MNTIQELLKIVTKYGGKKFDPIATNEGKDDKYDGATKNIINGKVSNEEELASLVSMDFQSGQFRNFKYRLKEKILNNLFLLDFNSREVSNYGLAIFRCSRNEYCIKLLLHLYARQTAIKLAKTTLKTAIEFELADIALYCARMLRMHYSLLGDHKEFEKYSSVAAKYGKILLAENETSEYLELIYVMHVNSNVFDNRNIRPIKARLLQVEKLMAKYDTYQIGLSYYRLKSSSEFLSHNYLQALNTWEDFDKFIERYKNFEFEVRRGESALNQLDCYLHMRDFENSTKCAAICESVFKHSTINWFIYKEYYFLLSMHTRNYQQVNEIIETVMNNPQFKNQNVNRKERWSLFDAYFNLFLQYGQMGKCKTGKRKAKYRFTKFLNATPIHSKDKKGYNASIHIIHAVYLLLERDYTGFANIADSLKRYTSRYLSDNQNIRSQIFFEMLIEIDRSNYNLSDIKKTTNERNIQLSNSQFKYISSLDGLEIVPFTDLWDIIIESLA